MLTATANRLSTHGPAAIPALAQNGRMLRCKYAGCKCKFPTEQGMRMHVGRVHTRTIPTASSRSIKKGLAKAEKQAQAKFGGVALKPATAPKVKGMPCCITGPGLRIEFASDLMPTILHTIALSLSGK